MKLESMNPVELFEDNGQDVTAEFAELLESTESNWGTGQAEELAELLGVKCYSENTFNNPDETQHHDRVIQYHVLTAEEEWFYADALVLVEEHAGGDVRGNYLNARVFKVNMEDIMGMLYVDPSEFDEEESA